MSTSTRREQRLAAERAERAREARRKRAWQAGAVLFVALALAAAVVAATREGGGPPAPEDVSLAVAGFPERGGVLGDAAAPVTVTEFADLQCPVCKAFAADGLPALLERVRAGDVKLRLATLAFIGSDSERLARAAAAAQRQNGRWAFTEAAYARQGGENSGYATDDWIRGTARAARLDPDRLLRDMAAADAARPIADAQARARQLGIDSTPTFVVQRAGGRPRVVDANRLEAALNG